MDLAKVVSVRTAYQWNEGSIGREPSRVLRPGSRLHVVAYDFGIKRNILRLLADYGCRMTVVPAQTSAADALALNPDGIFLSNGPGDPEPCDYAIAAIQEFLETDVPVFGICLGHQLLGLASGAQTVKMKFGHHGANHPVQELAGGHVLITSQNHGFAVDEDTLPSTVQGDAPLPVRWVAAGNRAHGPARLRIPGPPEASPGPHDLRPLFEHFVFLMVRRLQQMLRAQVAVAEGAAAR
jgi:carbamoyl-phosphate synthase small subunit